MLKTQLQGAFLQVYLSTYDFDQVPCAVGQCQSIHLHHSLQAAYRAVVSKKFSDVKHLGGGVYGKSAKCWCSMAQAVEGLQKPLLHSPDRSKLLNS